MASGLVAKDMKSVDVTVTLATNSSVSPWSTYGQIATENIPSGYKVINAIYVGASSNYGGFTIKTDGGLYCYGKNTGAHTVRLLCIKD